MSDTAGADILSVSKERLFHCAPPSQAVAMTVIGRK